MQHYRINPSYIIMLFSLLLLSSCQEDTKIPDTIEINIKFVAREIMNNANTCALITVDSLNRPRVRMMGTMKPESDFTVWLGTNPQSAKVAQIKENPNVTLYYTEEGNSGYVMLQGTAQLVNDVMKKEIFWKDEWKTFYPNYPDDYLLIKVSPNWLEVVSYKHNIISESDTWEPQKIIFDK